MQINRYSVASAADSKEIIDLLATVFSESEPPAVAVGLSSAEIEAFLGLIVPTMLPQQLTVTARNEGGQMAGVLLTEDFGLFPDIDHSKISPRMVPIMTMLDHLDRQYLNGRTVQPGEHSHLFMLAVDPRFSGSGIAKTMVATVLENSAGKGYRMAVTEATGNVSQHIFRKQGFVDRVSISYQEFRIDGAAPFASIQGHQGAILMDKSLR